MFAVLFYDNCGDVIDVVGPFDSENAADQEGQRMVQYHDDDNSEELMPNGSSYSVYYLSSPR